MKDADFNIISVLAKNAEREAKRALKYAQQAHDDNKTEAQRYMLGRLSEASRLVVIRRANRIIQLLKDGI